MSDRVDKLLESVGTLQSRRRRLDRSKQDAADIALESTRGARPTDGISSMSGVDVQDEPEGNEFAPVAANLGINGDDVPGDETLPGDEPGDDLMPATDELDPAAIEAKSVELGMKPIEIAGLDMEVLRRGAEHEQEHFDDLNLAAAVAAHHIMKYPTYYDALEKMEAEMTDGTEEPTPGDEATPDENDFEELSPDSMGGVDDEGDEDEEIDD